VVELRVEAHALLIDVVRADVDELVVVRVFEVGEGDLLAVVRVDPPREEVEHQVGDLLGRDHRVVVVE
jgi:hypothetical protein